MFELKLNNNVIFNFIAGTGKLGKLGRKRREMKLKSMEAEAKKLDLEKIAKPVADVFKNANVCMKKLPHERKCKVAKQIITIDNISGDVDIKANFHKEKDEDGKVGQDSLSSRSTPRRVSAAKFSVLEMLRAGGQFISNPEKKQKKKLDQEKIVVVKEKLSKIVKRKCAGSGLTVKKGKLRKPLITYSRGQNKVKAIPDEVLPLKSCSNLQLDNIFQTIQSSDSQSEKRNVISENPEAKKYEDKLRDDISSHGSAEQSNRTLYTKTTKQVTEKDLETGKRSNTISASVEMDTENFKSSNKNLKPIQSVSDVENVSEDEDPAFLIARRRSSDSSSSEVSRVSFSFQVGPHNKTYAQPSYRPGSVSPSHWNPQGMDTSKSFHDVVKQLENNDSTQQDGSSGKQVIKDINSPKNISVRKKKYFTKIRLIEKIGSKKKKEIKFKRKAKMLTKCRKKILPEYQYNKLLIETGNSESSDKKGLEHQDGDKNTGKRKTTGIKLKQKNKMTRKTLTNISTGDQLSKIPLKKFESSDTTGLKHKDGDKKTEKRKTAGIKLKQKKKISRKTHADISTENQLCKIPLKNVILERPKKENPEIQKKVQINLSKLANTAVAQKSLSDQYNFQSHEDSLNVISKSPSNDLPKGLLPPGTKPATQGTRKFPSSLPRLEPRLGDVDKCKISQVTPICSSGNPSSEVSRSSNDNATLAASQKAMAASKARSMRLSDGDWLIQATCNTKITRKSSIDENQKPICDNLFSEPHSKVAKKQGTTPKILQGGEEENVQELLPVIQNTTSLGDKSCNMHENSEMIVKKRGRGRKPKLSKSMPAKWNIKGNEKQILSPDQEIKPIEISKNIPSSVIKLPESFENTTLKQQIESCLSTNSDQKQEKGGINNIILSNVVATKIVRRRGRPPKSNTEPKTPKKRGRPPKRFLEKSVSTPAPKICTVAPLPILTPTVPTHSPPTLSSESTTKMSSFSSMATAITSEPTTKLTSFSAMDINATLCSLKIKLAKTTPKKIDDPAILQNISQKVKEGDSNEVQPSSENTSIRENVKKIEEKRMKTKKQHRNIKHNRGRTQSDSHEKTTVVSKTASAEELYMNELKKKLTSTIKPSRKNYWRRTQKNDIPTGLVKGSSSFAAPSNKTLSPIQYSTASELLNVQDLHTSLHDDDSVWFKPSSTQGHIQSPPTGMVAQTPTQSSPSVRVSKTVLDEFDLMEKIGFEKLVLQRLAADDISEMQLQIKNEEKHRRREHNMPLVMQMTNLEVERSFTYFDIDISVLKGQNMAPERVKTPPPIFETLCTISDGSSRCGSIDSSRRGSIDSIQIFSNHSSRRGSVEDSRRGSTDSIQRGSIDSSRRGSINSLQDMDNDSNRSDSINNSRRGSIDNSRRGSIDNSRRGSTDSVHIGRTNSSQRGSINSLQDVENDSNRSGSINNSRRANIDSSRRGSTNSIQRGSINSLQDIDNDSNRCGSIDNSQRGSIDSSRRGSINSLQDMDNNSRQSGSIDKSGRGSIDNCRIGSTDSILRGSIGCSRRGSINSLQDMDNESDTGFIHSRKSPTVEVIDLADTDDGSGDTDEDNEKGSAHIDQENTVQPSPLEVVEPQRESAAKPSDIKICETYGSTAVWQAMSDNNLTKLNTVNEPSQETQVITILNTESGNSSDSRESSDEIQGTQVIIVNTTSTDPVLDSPASVDDNSDSFVPKDVWLEASEGISAEGDSVLLLKEVSLDKLPEEGGDDNLPEESEETTTEDFISISDEVKSNSEVDEVPCDKQLPEASDQTQNVDVIEVSNAVPMGPPKPRKRNYSRKRRGCYRRCEHGFSLKQKSKQTTNFKPVERGKKTRKRKLHEQLDHYRFRTKRVAVDYSPDAFSHIFDLEKKSKGGNVDTSRDNEGHDSTDHVSDSSSVSNSYSKNIVNNTSQEHDVSPLSLKLKMNVTGSKAHGGKVWTVQKAEHIPLENTSPVANKSRQKKIRSGRFCVLLENIPVNEDNIVLVSKFIEGDRDSSIKHIDQSTELRHKKLASDSPLENLNDPLWEAQKKRLSTPSVEDVNSQDSSTSGNSNKSNSSGRKKTPVKKRSGLDVAFLKTSKRRRKASVDSPKFRTSLSALHQQTVMNLEVSVPEILYGDAVNNDDDTPYDDVMYKLSLVSPVESDAGDDSPPRPSSPQPPSHSCNILSQIQQELSKASQDTDKSFKQVESSKQDVVQFDKTCSSKDASTLYSVREEIVRFHTPEITQFSERVDYAFSSIIEDNNVMSKEKQESDAPQSDKNQLTGMAIDSPKEREASKNVSISEGKEEKIVHLQKCVAEDLVYSPDSSCAESSNVTQLDILKSRESSVTNLDEFSDIPDAMKDNLEEQSDPEKFSTSNDQSIAQSSTTDDQHITANTRDVKEPVITETLVKEIPDEYSRSEEKDIDNNQLHNQNLLRFLNLVPSVNGKKDFIVPKRPDIEEQGDDNREVGDLPDCDTAQATGSSMKQDNKPQFIKDSMPLSNYQKKTSHREVMSTTTDMLDVAANDEDQDRHFSEDLSGKVEEPLDTSENINIHKSIDSFIPPSEESDKNKNDEIKNVHKGDTAVEESVELDDADIVTPSVHVKDTRAFTEVCDMPAQHTVNVEGSRVVGPDRLPPVNESLSEPASHTEENTNLNISSAPTTPALLSMPDFNTFLGIPDRSSDEVKTPKESSKELSVEAILHNERGKTELGSSTSPTKEKNLKLSNEVVESRKKTTIIESPMSPGETETEACDCIQEILPTPVEALSEVCLPTSPTEQKKELDKNENNETIIESPLSPCKIETTFDCGQENILTCGESLSFSQKSQKNLKVGNDREETMNYKAITESPTSPCETEIISDTITEKMPQFDLPSSPIDKKLKNDVEEAKNNRVVIESPLSPCEMKNIFDSAQEIVTLPEEMESPFSPTEQINSNDSNDSRVVIESPMSPCEMVSDSAQEIVLAETSDECIRSPSPPCSPCSPAILVSEPPVIPSVPQILSHTPAMIPLNITENDSIQADEEESCRQKLAQLLGHAWPRPGSPRDHRSGRSSRTRKHDVKAPYCEWRVGGVKPCVSKSEQFPATLSNKPCLPLSTSTALPLGVPKISRWDQRPPRSDNRTDNNAGTQENSDKVICAPDITKDSDDHNVKDVSKYSHQHH